MILFFRFAPGRGGATFGAAAPRANRVPRALAPADRSAHDAARHLHFRPDSHRRVDARERRREASTTQEKRKSQSGGGWRCDPWHSGERRRVANAGGAWHSGDGDELEAARHREEQELEAAGHREVQSKCLCCCVFLFYFITEFFIMLMVLLNDSYPEIVFVFHSIVLLNT